MYTSTGFHIWDDIDTDDDGTSEYVAVTQRKRDKVLRTNPPLFNLKFKSFYNYNPHKLPT